MVVSGLYVREEEFKNPSDCGGDEVTGVGEDVEGGTESVKLSLVEVVRGGVADEVDGKGIQEEGDSLVLGG